MRTRLRAWLLLPLLALAAVGCSECERDFDCPGTKVCNVSSGTCQAFVCKTDRDCPPTHACRSNACRARTPPAAGEPADALLLSAPSSFPSAAPVTDAGAFTQPD